MAKITAITARQILDSRGNPTVEATVVLDDGSEGIASCPSGASVGSFEAIALPPSEAINHITNIIAPELISLEVSDQKQIDEVMCELDATPNKAKLGANAILSVSMAVCKAAAVSLDMPLFRYIAQISHNTTLTLPTPVFNILNGGLHAGRNIDFQEFMVIPAKNDTFASSLQLGTQLYHLLKATLKEKKLSTLVGDEGGFAPTLASNKDALELLAEVVKKANLTLGKEVSLGLDVASNTFYKDGTYHIKEKDQPLSTGEIINYYAELAREYKLSYLEDGLSEDDFEGWSKLTSMLSAHTLIVGDDLTVTNSTRLQTAIDKKAISAILIKPNQIGTVTETIEVVKKAQLTGIKIVVSHRSGETTDDFIADFAVGVGADFVKFGAPARGERVVKYNRLLQIEKELIKA